MVIISGRDVGNTGFGLMGFGFLEGQNQLEERVFPTMRAALKNGAKFWNGAEFYGKLEGPNSLTLAHQYFKKYPEDAKEVVLCIKGGLLPGMKIDGTPAGLRQSVENCLSLLPPEVKKIDVFSASRVDPDTPIETTISALAEMVNEGKIGAISLTEVKAETIRRAAKVHPIATVELELNITETRNIDNGVLATCAELGIPVVAYSPLGQGFLVGRFQDRKELSVNDPRLRFPQYSEENFPKNVALARKVDEVARRIHCTPAQLALAWIRQFSSMPHFPPCLPIPGATTVQRIDENCKEIKLGDAEQKEIDDLLKNLVTSGNRYPELFMKYLEG